MTDFEDYEGFVEKFKPKKTTDDCYTPPEIYEAVKGWACEKWGIDPGSCVRPFYPGGDFYRFDYPEGCTVLDNPPFSLLAKICAYYLRGHPVLPVRAVAYRAVRAQAREAHEPRHR